MSVATLSPSIPTPISAPIKPGGITLSEKPHVRKVSAATLAVSVLGRAVNPKHLWTAAKLHYHRKANRRAFDDTRLALYSQILPSDFLHYGYFDDVDTTAENMSLTSLVTAQTRYAELLIDLAGDPATADPVLDIGCGIGGLSRMLTDRRFNPTALTPDRMQAAYVAKMQPNVPVLRCKLEKMPTTDYMHKFGTVFTAESLQYLKLDLALPILADILKPGGKWIACDYFLTNASGDKTCHNWDFFQNRLTQTGWKITYERDVTPNVLPTLRFLHMLATRFGLPLMDFATLRLRRKQPGIHHLLTPMLGLIEGVASDNVGLINPTQFAADRRYMMLTMERA